MTLNCAISGKDVFDNFLMFSIPTTFNSPNPLLTPPLFSSIFKRIGIKFVLILFNQLKPTSFMGEREGISVNSGYKTIKAEDPQLSICF